MGKHSPNERESARASDVREPRPFPISFGGWIGICAALVGIAYFVFPDGVAEQPSDRKPPAAARIEVPQAAVNRYDVVEPSARPKPPDESAVATKREEAPRSDADRAEKGRAR
jgi:hypothetical protein